MFNVAGPPNGVERRAYRLHDATLENIPALATPLATAEKLSSSLKQSSSRSHFLQVLEGQIERSIQRKYPLCLVLVEFEQQTHESVEADSILQAVTGLFNDHLRPTDIIIRYRKKTLALILHEANDDGGLCVATRLGQVLSKGVKIEGRDVRLTPLFGVSSNFTGEKERAAKLLANAESLLQIARRH